MKRQLRSLIAETISSRLLAGLKSVSAMAILSLLFVSWSTNSRAQVDCNPEIIVDCPAPATVSCVDFQSMIATPPAYSVTCNVEGTVEVTSSDNTISSNACGYTLVRTWTYSIGDLSTTCSQVYNVIDNVGPVISGLGGDRVVECDQPMPGASEFVANDACGQVVQTEVLVSSSQSNSDATAGRQIRCQLTTPFGPGPDGSIWLNNAQQLGLASSNYWSWTGTPQLVSFDDGTAHLTGDVVNNANAAQGWHVDMWFKNRRDWAAWSALGRSYKDDLGFGSANHLNWDYYELADVFSTLTGYGTYTGNVLYMSHQPTNYYFGFQAGVGANNRNGNEGMSGWFYWNGWFNGQWRTGNGDMFTDKFCIPENNACEYTQTYVYRAKDACGNNSFASETITVRDTQAPVFQNCPESLTIECGTEVPASIAAEDIVAVDACHNATVSYLGETVENPDACTTVISRRYVATDECGNSARCTQTITIVDTLAPVLSVPANIDAQCHEQVVIADASATDCHGFEISEVRDTIAGQCPQSYTIIRHFTATDICGNSSEGTQEIHVTDSEAPVFDQLDTYVQVECTEVDNVPAPTATDRCGAVTVQLVEETLNSGGCLGVLQRIYVAYDECGNASEEANVYITILDTTAPVINAPEGGTYECDQVPSHPEVVVTDNCGNDVTVTFDSLRINGSCPDTYTLIWHWHAVDFCDNFSDEYVYIHVEDTTDPVFVTYPNDTTILCSQEIPAPADLLVIDNCAGVIVPNHADVETPGECPNERTIMRIYRATDNCGHSALAVQYIYVVDTEAPTFDYVPESVTIECSAALPTDNAQASDLCGDATVSSTDAIIEETECLKVIRRTFVATDLCGNTSEATQTITIVDTTAPQIEGSYTIERPCSDYAGIYIEYSDNCQESITATYEDTHVSGGCQGRIIRNYTVTDVCGNATQWEQIITLTDDVAPAHGDVAPTMFVECNTEYEVPSISFSDNCDDELDITYDQETVSSDSCTTIIHYWTFAEDNCANRDSAYIEVIISDRTNPSIYAPQGGEFTCEAGITYGEATAEDNCDANVTITYSDARTEGNCPGNYSVVRTWTATDNCGNQAEATSTYYVYDNQGPEFTFVPENVTIECSDAMPTDEATAADLCSGASVSSSDETIDNNPCHTVIKRTFDAVDLCGNHSYAYQYITKVDTQAPVFAAHSETLTLPCDNYEGIFVTAEDNCNGAEIWSSDMRVSGGCEGRIIRTYYAQDACGNIDSTMQIITLLDVVAPNQTNQVEDMTVECNTEYSVSAITFADNCDDELDLNEWVETVSSDSCTTVLHYWFKATDNCDNADSAYVTVTITDTTNPSIYAPQGGEFTCEEGITYGEATAEDNCDANVTITYSDARTEGNCPGNYSVVRTWTATDNCGNHAEATSTYYVYDNQGPEFTFVPENVTIECSDAMPTDEATAADLCSGASVSSSDETIDNNPCHTVIKRTFDAVDLCGNHSYAYQYITKVDTQAPVFAAHSETLSRPCNDYEGIFVTADDNCNGVEIWSSDIHVSGGCQGRIIRTYYAQDACGNIDSIMQIITLVDTELPTLENPTQDTTIIECGMPMPEYSPIWSDNCDDELELLSAVQMVENGCDKVYTYSYSATDNCDNVTSAGHVVIVRDTQAPTWNEGAASDTITIQCGTEINLVAPTASDACSDVTITPRYERIDGNCPANYTEIFSWVANDACGNTSEAITIVVNHEDVQAPNATSTPQGGEYACDAQVPFEEPTFSDFCSEVSVAYEDTIIAGNCPNSYTIVRSWTPSDACGNVGETVTVSYFVYDNVAPTFNNTPADEYYQCQPADWSPVAVTATDNCQGEVSVVPSVSSDLDDCGNGVIVVTYIATDLCGNSSSIAYRVNIEDTTDPTFDSTPEELIVLNCDQEIPAADELTATDNCDNNVDVTFVENITPGVQLIENAVSACSLITPDINLSGNCKTYYNNKNWALWLGSMPPVHRYFSIASGYLYTMNDGSLQLVATFVNSTNPALGGFTATVKFANPLDWAQWSTQAFMTSFKADCGGVGANHTDWTYYLLQGGSGAELTGYGSYVGSSLDLAHAPSNKYFGFQVGEGANNLTPGYGIGGWFTYNGTILVDGNPIMSGTAGGAGDFAINLDCCPKTVVNRCWTATDCSNNSVSVCQTIRYQGSNATAPQAPTAEVVRVQPESNLSIVSVFPNPSAETAEMRVVSKTDSKIVVDVVDMTGRKVAAVYQGDVQAGLTYRFNINSREMNNGLYQIRVMSDKDVATKQMNVVR